jgi:hypothetical protein
MEEIISTEILLRVLQAFKKARVKKKIINKNQIYKKTNSMMLTRKDKSRLKDKLILIYQSAKKIVIE